MDIKIIVAVHKKYWLPKETCYYPVQVGHAAAQVSLGIPGDDTGANISLKNPHYCELTGLYWAWKNLQADYIGLCHYRRYFGHAGPFVSLEGKKQCLLKDRDYAQLLQDCDCLVPFKRHYYIETARSQYEHAHQKKDLDLLEQVVEELYPAYSSTFKEVMKKKSLHIANMFVMKRTLLDAYCTFLFRILFEVESRIDISGYSPMEARVFGYLSERLLDVWLIKNKIAYKEVPIVFLEKINWLKKGSKFIIRKFKGT